LRLAGAVAVAAMLNAVAAAADPVSSFGPVLSADGRYAAFTSNAANLVAGVLDTNGTYDLFLRDRTAHTTTLVSHLAASSQTAAGGTSFGAGMSADGRYLAFLSDATDLVPSTTDGNHGFDTFLYDRQTGLVTLVSHASGQPATAANGSGSQALISADGNYVAFTSSATNLVAGQVDGNAGQDVFLYHRPSGTLTLVTAKGGTTTTTANAPSLFGGISADGRAVLIASSASDLVSGLADGNGATDVFVYDRPSAKVFAVSRAAGKPARTSNGSSSGAQISGDGRWVAFHSNGTNLIKGQSDTSSSFDEFLFDRKKSEMRLVSHQDGAPRVAVGVETHAISPGGGYLVFASPATNLVAGQVDTNGKADVFLYDVASRKTSLITHQPGAPRTTGSGASLIGLAVDASGRQVGLLSATSDLLPGLVDDNGGRDAFLFDRPTGTMTLISHRFGSPHITGDGSTESFQFSGDGATVAFSSLAGDLTAAVPETDHSEDVFAYSVRSGLIEGISKP
jgi:Tol biopolymer transport system component